MEKYLPALYFLFFSLNATPQQWKYVGDTAACDFAAENPMVSVNRYKEVSIVYRDMSNAPEGIAVKKFTANQWSHEGGYVYTGWTLGGYHQPCLSHDTAGFPYIAICNDHLTVRRFDGSNWITVGDTQFTPGVATSVSLKISPDNTPYVAFRDFAHNANISVMKFNDTNWVYVGQPGFSPNSIHQYDGAWCPSLVFDSTGTPYIAYIDITNGYRLSVMKYNGSSWIYVGNPNVSGGDAAIPTLVIDGHGAPIVGYSDGNAQVKKFDGSSWTSLGQPGFAAAIDFPFLAIDKRDVIYFVYTCNHKASVMEYHGSAWLPCGNMDFHPNAYYTTIDVTDDGSMVYVGLLDGRDIYYPPPGSGTYNIVSVMVLDKSFSVQNMEPSNSSMLTVYPNPAEGKAQVFFDPLTQDDGLLKISNAMGEVIYSERLFGFFQKEINLQHYSKGIYFVEVTTSRFRQLKKVILD